MVAKKLDIEARSAVSKYFPPVFRFAFPKIVNSRGEQIEKLQPAR